MGNREGVTWETGGDKDVSWWIEVGRMSAEGWKIGGCQFGECQQRE